MSDEAQNARNPDSNDAMADRKKFRDRVKARHPGLKKHQLDTVVAYEAFLNALFGPSEHSDPDNPEWALGGSAVLIFRGKGGRFTGDVDLDRITEPTDKPASLSDLLKSINKNLDGTDNPYGFTFAMDRENATQSVHSYYDNGELREQITGYRVPTTVYLRGLKVAEIWLDLSTLPFEGELTHFKPLGFVEPNDEAISYPSYSVEDVVAGKLARMLFTDAVAEQELAEMAEDSGEVPSVYWRNAKDYYDLAVLAQRATLDSEKLRNAFQRVTNSQTEPDADPITAIAIDRPDFLTNWESNLSRHHAKGRMSPIVAVEHVKMLIDPILEGSAYGHYNPHTGTWWNESPTPDVDMESLDPQYLLDPPILDRAQKVAVEIDAEAYRGVSRIVELG